VRVVYVSTLERGGPLSHVRDLAPAMAAAGVDVHVVVANERLAAEFRGLGVDASVASMRHKLDARGAARAWPALAGADVVHTHDRRAGLLARPQARLRGAASVHTLHGVPEELSIRVGRAGDPVPPGVSSARIAWVRHGILRFEALLSHLGAVVVPSQALAEFLAQHGFPRRRMHVIPYGVEPRVVDARPLRDPAVFGTAANLEYHKGIEILLAAAARVNPPPVLEIYGDGSARGELEAEAARLGVEARFHGFDPDFRSKLGELDVFVLPTRGDNLPVSILEAMAAGLPVIATRVGGIPEQVEDGATGYLVEPDDVGGLAEAIGRLASDPARREEFGRAGAEKLEREFSSTSVAGRLLELYERVAAGR
jgi:glycosyltransferase involved in cell wall biosynthesis